MTPEFEKLLLDCLKKNSSGPDIAALSGLSGENWISLIALAKKHKLVPLLRRSLRHKNLFDIVPQPAREFFDMAARRTAAGNLQYYADLRELLSALKSRKTHVILLKGIHIAEAVYGNIGLREMNDIDILVRGADIEFAAETLSGMGYSPLRPVCAEISFKTSQDIPRMVKDGHAPFEIHWNLTQPGKSHSIDPDGLWERAVAFKAHGCEALALSNEDLLLHICVHASYHHQFAFGLQPYFDIAELISRTESAIRWDTVLERAGSFEWIKGTAIALSLAKDLAGAEVPEHVLAGLRGGEIPAPVLTAARGQIFTDRTFAASLPVSMARLLESGKLSAKCRIFFSRLFLPRAEIASQYSVPENSMKIYFYYARRLFYLLSRYGLVLKSFREGDSRLRALSARKNLVSSWLVPDRALDNLHSCKEKGRQALPV